MLKVAIYKGFGVNKIPKRFQDKVKDFSLEGRIALAEEISKVEVYDGLLPLSEEILENYYKQGKDVIHVVTDKGEQLVCLESKCDCYIISVVEVDTEKPWRIGLYDGSEGIEYFDGLTVVNKEHNMCNW